MARTLWKIRHPDGTETEHSSEPETYRVIDALRRADANGTHLVYIDGQDGFGWQLYERLNFDEEH